MQAQVGNLERNMELCAYSYRTHILVILALYRVRKGLYGMISSINENRMAKTCHRYDCILELDRYMLFSIAQSTTLLNCDHMGRT